METWLILCIVFSSLALVYILLFLMNLAFIHIFLKKLKEHKHALNIIFIQKYEVISQLIHLLKKQNVDIDDKFVELFNEISKDDFSSFECEECENSRNKLALLKQEILGTCKKHEEILKNNEYKNFAESLTLIDNQIRYLVISYNADIIGYNYWIRFKPYRYILSLSGLKEKDIK